MALSNDDAGTEKIAYLETVRVGDALPDMPLILASGLHVMVRDPVVVMSALRR